MNLVKQKIILHRDEMNLMNDQNGIVDHWKTGWKRLQGINAVDCIPKQASASNRILQLERDVADRFMDILFRCVGKFNCIIHSRPQ